MTPAPRQTMHRTTHTRGTHARRAFTTRQRARARRPRHPPRPCREAAGRTSQCSATDGPKSPSAIPRASLAAAGWQASFCALATAAVDKWEPLVGRAPG